MKIHANDPEREIVQTFPNGMRDREHFAKWRTFNCQKCVIGEHSNTRSGHDPPRIGVSYPGHAPPSPQEARRRVSVRPALLYQPPAPDAPPRGYPRPASGFSTPGPGERRDSGKVPLYRNFGLRGWLCHKCNLDDVLVGTEGIDIVVAA